MLHCRFRLPDARRVCSVALVLGVTACGGGGGGGGAASSGSTGGGTVTPTISTVQLGTFVDGPVANLQYSAAPSGLSGSTDPHGAFNFKAGDTVSFSFGGLALGSAKPANSQNGAVIVTPMALTGETDPANSPKAATLAALLNTLDAVSTWQNGHGGPYGTLVLPPASASGFATLVSDLVALGNPQSITSVQLQAVLDALFGTSAGQSNVQAVSQLTGQTLVTQAMQGTAVAGTVWQGTLTNAANVSVPWHVYFSPDNLAYAFAGSGKTDAGIWTVNNSGTISLILSNPAGSATIAQGATSFSGTVVDPADPTGNTTMAAAASEVIAATVQPTTYTGAWHADLTPTAMGGAASTALLVVDPAGKLNGVASDGSVLSGSVDLSTGAATATSSAAATLSLSLDFARQTGTEASGSVVQDTIALTHSAAF